jgi:hypothetical protein
VSATERVSASRDHLAAHPYETNAGEFVRFRVTANDDVIAGTVRAVAAEGEEGCHEFRRRLGEDETDTLRLFAMRRTLQGRRQSSLSLTYEAIDGFALLPTLNDVPWDSWLQTALFVARSLGGDPEMIGRRFAEVANADAAARCDVAMEAMNRVEALSQCRIVETSTNYGVGFVEILVFRGTPTIGFLGAPRMGDNQLEYHPTTNLAQLTASLADALDASGKVVTSPISQDQLAATSFSLTASGSYLPTAGCLSFIADGVGGSASFTVFVAELPEDADIATLATAGANTNDQAAAYDTRRLILLSPQPNFDEDVDVVIDFCDFEDLAHSALLDSATW